MKDGMRLILSICIIIGCSSAKLMGQEARKTAYSKAVSKISKNKADPQNKEALKLALDKLLSNLSSRKAALVTKGNLLHLEQALIINEEAQSYLKGAVGYLTNDYNDQLTSLTTEHSELKNECAKGYFIEGENKFITAQASNDKQLGKEAFEAFQKAATYEYVYQDKLVELLLSSFEFAQVIYGLGPDDYNPLFAGWGESNNHFVRILSTDQIENSSCDCIIALDYETPVINDNNSSKSYNYTNIITDGYLPETVYTYHTDSQGNTKRIATVKRAPNKKSVKATVIVNEKREFVKHVRI